MNFKHYFNLEALHGYSGLFNVCGSFGRIDHTAKYEYNYNGTTAVFSYKNDFVQVISQWTELEYGVVHRKDKLVNLTEQEIELNSLLSRFSLVGNDYDVYTQYNGWQHESSGAWSHLTTQISVSAGGMRTCNGGTTILAMHNLYTQKNTVFHLLPNAQWTMTARKYPLDKRELVVVEVGINDDGLRLKVKPGETIDFPEIFFYQAENKIDLDAYKMHAVFNRLHPRKETPILYNSWLNCFEWLDVDKLKLQADIAAEMGIEIFVIDAGWFGKGENWLMSVGDWVENPTRNTMGRLKELSDYVHAKGMRMGLWFEPERASFASEAYQAHPEYYINNDPHWAFLDFSNEQAREYILDVISAQIKKYELAFVKFDFNASIPHDPSNFAFYRYMQGQKRFIEELRTRFPKLYISNCASGGFRMEMQQATYTDSFWFTDNQGPYEGLTIIKNTLMRLPNSCIERWNVQKYIEGFPAYEPNCIGRMVSCNNATWSYAITINDAYTEAFLMGGPIGFSCDLTSFPEKYRVSWKRFIAEYKKRIDFYANATARILIDTPQCICLQYADTQLDRCEIVLFTKLIYCKDILVYPAVDKNANYLFGEQTLSGTEIMENGLYFNELEDNDAITCTLIKVK